MSVSPPSAVALCASAGELPRGGIGACWAYEPKWDSYRVIVNVTAGGVQLLSRRGTDLTRWFPEVAAAGATLPIGTVLDGELVILDGARQDFPALLSRCHGSPRRTAELSRQRPAAVVAFDVVATPEGDLRRQPYRERRRVLELLLGAHPTAAVLTPMTTDVDEAELWMQAWAQHGMEGVVAKDFADRYHGGARRWIKVRRQVTHDVIVGGVLGTLDNARAVLVGRRDDDGVLRCVGITRPPDAGTRSLLAQVVEPARADAVWTDDAIRGAVHGLRGPRRELPTWTATAPTVVAEVIADSAFEFRRWRHTVRLHRLRPDVDARTVGLVGELAD